MKENIVIAASIIAGCLFGAALIFLATGSVHTAGMGAIVGAVCVACGMVAAWKLEEVRR